MYPNFYPICFTDIKLPTVKLNITETRKTLWGKTKAAFQYIHHHHKNDQAWYLKADDDTYVILENLRYFLSNYNTNEAWYFGCNYRRFVQAGYMSGGAGYVISQAALNRFVQEGLEGPSKVCKTDSKGSEDLELGLCLEKLKVQAGDSRDYFGRLRFFPVKPAVLLQPGYFEKDYWLYDYLMYPFSTVRFSFILALKQIWNQSTTASLSETVKKLERMRPDCD